MRGLIAAVMVAGAVIAAPAPDADAKFDCAHRGFDHAERHGGQLEDDRFHLMHHELPTCHDKKDGHHKADEDPAEAIHEGEHLEHDARKLEHLEPHEHHGMMHHHHRGV